MNNRQQLIEQQKKLQEQFQESLANDIEQWVSQGLDLARESGITMQEFVTRHALNAKTTAARNVGSHAKSKPARGLLPPKYAHPETDETWSGAGKMPAWLKDLLDAGWSLDTLRVDSSANANA